MADFWGFWLLRTLRSSTFLGDDLTCERHALPALGLASERPICLAGTGSAFARGLAHVTFPKSIANANDHQTLTTLAERGRAIDTDSQDYCEALALLSGAGPWIGWKLPRARLRHSHSNGPNRKWSSQALDQSRISAQIAKTTR